jgi:uncharacterized protein YndB with AHSA1/START domain
MKHEPFVIERIYRVPVERVWKAITDPKQMKEWYFDIPDFRPEVGSEFSFTGTDTEGLAWIHLCTVTEVIPFRKIAYTWQYKDQEGNSLVTWELFAQENGTRLKLTHSGLESFPPLKSLAKENFAMGWGEIVGKSLPAYLEKQLELSNH